MKNKYYIILPLFFINPFLAVSLMLFFTMFHPQRDEDWLKILLFLLALFMGLIQCTRIVQTGQPSDWVEYYQYYFLEAKYMNFFDYMHKGYMQESAKEPVFRIINYIGFCVFNGNFIWFTAFLLFLMYFAVYLAVYTFWKVNFIDVRFLVAAIVLFTFLTEFFTMTNNILRQQFATGIMTYVIAQKVVNNKMNWWLAGIACFSHTFTFVYLGLLFIKPLYSVIRTKALWQIIAVAIIVYLTFRYIPFFTKLFSFSDSLSYGLSRLENADVHHGTDNDILKNSNVVYLNLVLFLIVLLKMNYWDRPSGRGQAYYTNLIFFLMLFCAVFAYAPMLQIRAYSSRFFVMPFVVPFFFWKNKLLNSFYLWGIVVFFYCRFFLKFDSIAGGVFFPPIENVITRNLFQFL